jgi:NADH-quinone oxidoreductase subunit N
VAYSGLFSDFVLLYPSFTIANLFILIGLSFKLGLFPFHSWVPDVYQGAPLYSIVFLILIPKIAYISFIVTLILQFRGTWQFIPLTYLGIFSIIFSGVAAINQTYILRLLGYSTINNIGISVLPLAIGSMDGIVVTGVYLGIYLLLNAVVFSILGLCPILSLYDMSSLVVYPFLGLCFTLTMFSNAGIPPLVGFFGKYCVIASLFGNRGYFSGIIVIITSAISAFFLYTFNKLPILYGSKNGLKLI